MPLAAPRPLATLALAAALAWQPAPLDAQAAAQGTRYTHPLGYTLRVPAGWQMHRQLGSLMIYPADALRSPDGEPLEGIAVQFGGVGDGARQAGDPQSVADWDQLLAPALMRIGGEAAVATGLGAGTALRYRGEINGEERELRIHTVRHQGAQVALTYVAPVRRAGRLAAAHEAVSRSLGWTKPALDDALLRTWSRSTTEGSSDPVTGSVFVNSRLEFTFGADGVVRRRSDSRVDAGVPGASGTSSGGDGARGRFGTADGVLAVLWEDGELRLWEYRVFPHRGAPTLALDWPGNDTPLYFHLVR